MIQVQKVSIMKQIIENDVPTCDTKQCIHAGIYADLPVQQGQKRVNSEHGRFACISMHLVRELAMHLPCNTSFRL